MTNEHVTSERVGLSPSHVMNVLARYDLRIADLESQIRKLSEEEEATLFLRRSPKKSFIEKLKGLFE